MQVDFEPPIFTKQKKAIDLCLAACRKRQSLRTGYVHYFSESEEHTDTIPLYENFCFAIALYRQKTVESVLEGKTLLENLLNFQSPSGNFPVYLHEFPRCQDRMQGLKIAPLLLQLMRHFSSVISPELKQKLKLSLENMLEFYEPSLSGLWQHRYEMCKRDRSDVEFPIRTAQDWAEWLISRQLAEEVSLDLAFHSELQVLLDLSLPQPQEGFEPRPHLIEWLLAERLGFFSERLLRDHPLQMQLASLWPLSGLARLSDQTTLWKPFSDKGDAFRLFWGQGHLHSFVLPSLVPTSLSLLGKSEWEMLFDLPEEADQTHNDLFEILFFCSAFPDVELTINGQNGTVFSLGDQVQILSPGCKIHLYFELLSGSGHFRGHFSKANRPAQIRTKNYEVYDWQIGLRTLRRSSKAVVRAVCSVEV